MLRPILGRREEGFWWEKKGAMLLFQCENIVLSYKKIKREKYLKFKFEISNFIKTSPKLFKFRSVLIC